MRILVDGDIVKYRVGFASEHTYYDIYLDDKLVCSHDNAKEANAWLKANTDDDYTRVARIEVDPIENCLHSVKVVMRAIQEKYPDGTLEVYFSCSTPENWRTKFYPNYKANRKNQRRPTYYKEIGDYMNAMYICGTGENVEADDTIAIRADTCRQEDTKFVVVTIDKDMDQIEGLHYNWVKDEEYYVGRIEAGRSVALQAIMGDSTDNIKGIPGWGAAAAGVWLEQCPLDKTEDIILAAYAEVYPEVEAVYHATLNTALVSLPINGRQAEQWSEEVHEAQAAHEQAQEAALSSSDDTPSVGDG